MGWLGTGWEAEGEGWWRVWMEERGKGRFLKIS